MNRHLELFSPPARQIISHVFWAPRISQREIVEQTLIPQQSASRIISDLSQQKVLLQYERPPSGNRGKPGIDLAVNPEYAYGLGFAITPEYLSITLLDLSGNSVFSLSVPPTSAELEVTSVMATLQDLFKQLQQTTQVDVDRIVGCGVGIAGYFLDGESQMNHPYFIESWMDIDIVALFEQTFSMPVWLDNDATAAAGGEGIIGAGREYTDFAYIYISTLFGGGIIANRKVMRGANGNAGELAELLPPGVYPHPNLNLLKSILDRNGQQYDSVRELLQQVDIDTPGVKEWVHYCKNSLTLVMSACAALLDCQAIIIGGRATEPLVRKLLDETQIYAQNRRKSPRPLPKIIAGAAKVDPVSAGAAALPFRHFFT